MRPRSAALLGAALAAFLLAVRARAEDGRPFSGTWTLAGTRVSLPTGGERAAVFVHASGSLVIAKGDVLGKGFLGEVVAFDDGAGTFAGRAVFTDEAGDKVFVTLVAGRLGTGQRVEGRISGGTGRWARLAGDLFLSWKYVVAGGTDDFEALAVAVEGRVRTAPVSKTGAPAEAPK